MEPVKYSALIITDGKRITVKEGDITMEKVDAIVNAANSRLAGGGGVDGAIHRRGGPHIMDQCRKIIERIGTLSPGEAVETTGGQLPAKYIIHTVGPIWHGGDHGEEAILKKCYINALCLADSLGCKSIAFPAISTGAYGYPLEKAAHTAITSTKTYLSTEKTDIEEIRHVLYGKKAYNIFKKILLSHS